METITLLTMVNIVSMVKQKLGCAKQEKLFACIVEIFNIYPWFVPHPMFINCSLNFLNWDWRFDSVTDYV